ncbi:uncharacterized protein LOC102805652, partial [Saccoglossus kowalevskii]|uniref:Uncharacterized protein LOC102805652 n=1 Tax=Saccoglossus kowalevskii TaxID=10224 RepID=A0ABM0M9N9_SACKO
MTDGQFKDMLNEIGLEQDGLVDYSKLMALFNKKRPWSLHGVSTPIATPKPKLFLERPHTVASGELLQGRDWNEKMENKAQQTEPITPPEFKKMWEKEAKKAGIFEEEDKTYPLRVRPLAM